VVQEGQNRLRFGQLSKREETGLREVVKILKRESGKIRKSLLGNAVASR